LSDSTAQLWDARTGRELLALRHPQPIILRHPQPISFATFSPDGHKVVTTAPDKTTRLWDAATGRELLVLRHETEAWLATLSRDGQKVVTTLKDGTARLWDARTGRELLVLRHPQPVLSAELERALPDVRALMERFGVIGGGNTLRSAVLSPDGQKVLTTSLDRIRSGAKLSDPSLEHAVRLWDAVTGRELVVLRHEGAISYAELSPDGQKVATGSEDGTVRLWDAATGAELAILRHEKKVGGVRFSPDGQRALTRSASTVRLWQLPTHRSVEDLVNYAKGLALPGLNEAQCREFGIPSKLCTWPPP
jgi:WD40 repeat protein